MSFVSYAQNYEDVMLWRALKQVKNGFYVDVGAQHPVEDSVSKAFYEHGWRGIHIEPVPFYARLLRQDRPDERVLEIAISDIEGTLELNVIDDTGLSTAVDEYAKKHFTEHGFDCHRIQVPVLTLKSALQFLEGKDVHWLKIDVEGLEEKVLKGWDSHALRPWIMVVEATIPNSTETDYASWEPILISSDYQFVYFDGLNRFYVAKEHPELLSAMTCPPNVFDDFKLIHQLSAEVRAAEAEERAAEAEERAAEAEERAEEAEERAAEAEERAGHIQSQYDSLLNSYSLRITAPLRWLKKMINGHRENNGHKAQ